MMMMTWTGVAGTAGWMGVLDGFEKIESSLGCCGSYTYYGYHDYLYMSIFNNKTLISYGDGPLSRCTRKEE